MELVKWFKKKYPDIVMAMKNSSHDVDDDNQSPFHCEGDVYTHTMMVYATLQNRPIEYRLTALLHDIEKPSTRKVKERDGRTYCAFTNHENVSTFMAIDILTEYEKDFNEKVNKVNILKAINWHQILHKIGTVNNGSFELAEEEKWFLNKRFGNDIEFYEMLVEVGRADALGRICNDHHILKTRYDGLNAFIPVSIYHDKTNKPKAYILTGLPGSGKTKIAEELMKTDSFVYLSTDEIIMRKAKGRDYRMLFDGKAFEEAELLMFDELKRAVLERKNIIIDRTHVTEKVRRRVSSIIPDKHYHKESISVLVGESELFKRNKERKKDGRSLPEELLMSKMQEYTLPGGEMFHENKIII